MEGAVIPALSSARADYDSRLPDESSPLCAYCQEGASDYCCSDCAADFASEDRQQGERDGD